MICVELARGFATLPEANWNRSSSFSVTSRSKPPSDTSDASSASDRRSTTESELSRRAESAPGNDSGRVADNPPGIVEHTYLQVGASLVRMREQRKHYLRSKPRRPELGRLRVRELLSSQLWRGDQIGYVNGRVRRILPSNGFTACADLPSLPSVMVFLQGLG
jgi:hypothetical protein